MRELKGDFWAYWQDNIKDIDAIVCTTNKIVKKDGALVMGGGIAKDFRDRFQGLDEVWGKRVKRNPTQGLMVNSLGIWGYWQFAVAFPTKHDWREDSYISLITTSARELENVTNAMDWSNVLMTRPGCGLGNLEWNTIKPLLQDFLDHRFIVIHNE